MKNKNTNIFKNNKKRFFEKTVIFTLFSCVTITIFILGILNAPIASATVCVKPIDVMIVIDSSGSMTDNNKMVTTKTAAKNFIDNLNLSTALPNGDQVGIVSFSTDALLQNSLSQNGGLVKSKIDTLIPSGQTNLYEAIEKSRIELSSSNHNATANRVMVILSDGNPNRPFPENTAGQLAIDAATEVKNTYGIRIITIGLELQTLTEAEALAARAILREVATAPSDFYESTDTSVLNTIYNTISQSLCDTVPPVISSITQSPSGTAYPVDQRGTVYASDQIKITSTVSDDYGIKHNYIKWQVSGGTCNGSINDGSWSNISNDIGCDVLRNNCQVNIGPCTSGTNVQYKIEATDNNDNNTISNVYSFNIANVSISASTFLLNSSNTITLDVNDPDGKLITENSKFYISIESPLGVYKINKAPMTCSGTANNRSCNYTVSPDCTWTDPSAKIYVFPYDDYYTAYHQPLIKTIAVNSKEEKLYGALDLDGVDDSANIGNPVSLQLTGAITISAWVNPHAKTGNPRLVSKSGGSGSRGWDLNIETGPNSYTFQVAVDATNNISASSTSADGPVINEWAHIVGVYKPGEYLALYKNGVKVAENITSIPASQFNSSNNAYIGRRSNGLYFNGLIDEVRIYNRALSAQEISQLYNDVYTNNIGLAGWWPLDELSGTVANDLSSNGNNGTLMNGVIYSKGGGLNSVNNVPSSWRMCSDTIDNNCNGKIDSQESSCDDSLPIVSLSRTLPVGDVFETDDIVIRTTATDLPAGINKISYHDLWYRINSGAWIVAFNCADVSPVDGLCDSDTAKDITDYSVNIGKFSPGSVVEYYASAYDSAPVSNGGWMTGTDTIKYSECYNPDGTEKSALASCTGGKCCGGVCNTAQTCTLDAGCAKESCSGTSWTCEADAVKNGSSCGAGASCYAWSFGCENRVFACNAGLCNYTTPVWNSDGCTSNTLNDYGCAGNSCGLSSSTDCSLPGAINGCACTCGGHGIEEKFYSSLQLDGSDDFIDAGSAASLYPANAISVEAWINPSSIASNGTLLGTAGNWASGGYSLDFFNQGNKIEFWVNNYSTNRVVSSSVIPIGTWTHVIGTYDKSSIKLYIDGNLAGSYPYTAALINPGDKLRIGTTTLNADIKPFNGKIDEVRIYNRALFGSEVVQHYNGQYVDDTGLVALWHMDGNANDSSGNGNNGMLNLGTLGNTIAVNAWISNKADIVKPTGTMLKYDGTDDHIDLAAHATDAEFNTATGTVSMWVKANQTASYVPLFHFRKSDASNFLIVRDQSSYIEIWESVGSTKFNLTTSVGSISRGSWYNLTFTQNGSGVEIYINGIKQSLSGGNGTAWFSDIFPIADFTFGDAAIWGAPNYFNGQMDDLRIYNRALNSAEIFQLYRGTYSDNTGLLGQWNLDGNANDSSGNGNNGILNLGTGGNINPANAWVNEVISVNNVPSPWEVCSDIIDNNCNGTIDAAEPTCDNLPPVLTIVRDKDPVFDNTTNITLVSTATDVSLLTQHKIKWTQDNWASSTEQVCPSSASPSSCSIVIGGSFTAGKAIRYKSEAVDGNGNWGYSPEYSFIVLSLECGGLPDLTSCASGVGSCCAQICDTTKTCGLAGDCSRDICVGDSWRCETDPLREGLSCGLGDVCSVFNLTGCEDNSYKCASGLCNATSSNQGEDSCTGSVLNNYACGASCLSTATNCDVAGSVNGCTCTCGGYGREEKFYRSVKLDGTDDYISVPDSNSLDISIQTGAEISMEAWVYPYTLDNETGIISKRSNYRMIIKSGGELKFQQFGWTGSALNVPAGKWSYIAITYNGTSQELNFYLDGQNKKVTGYVVNGGINGDMLYIGNGHDLTNGTFNGLISEARVYNRVLSLSEIGQHRNGEYLNETGLAGRWSFDGNTNDSSGVVPANNGTLLLGTSGNTDFSKAWENGQSDIKKSADVLKMDGLDDYITTGKDLINEYTGTIEAWAKADTLTGSHFIMHAGPGGGWGPGHEVSLVQSNNAMYFKYDGGGLSMSAAIPETNAWYHWLATYSGTTAVLYRNGEIVDTDTWNGGPIIKKHATSGAPWSVNLDRYGFRIGTYDDTSMSRGWSGALDEVRLYNRALSPEEAKEHFRGKYSNEAGLTGLWNLDGNANDSSGNGNNGTLKLGTSGNTNAVNAWTSDVVAASNVPLPLRVCDDGKDNNCDAGIDSAELSCDNIPPIIALSRDKVNVLNTDTVTLTSSATDSSGIISHRIKWSKDDWNTTNIQNCGAAGICNVAIGPFSAATATKYKSEAIDVNGNFAESAEDIFTVKDICDGLANGTSCAAGAGQCCGGFCDAVHYRKPITIIGSSSGPVTDYQVKVNVSYAAKMKSDFSDIYFTDSDGITNLSFWRESFVSDTFAIFWIKVPSIFAAPATKTIYAYYGSPIVASVSNGPATFNFYDDFTDTDGNDINRSKWTVYNAGNGTIQIQDNQARFDITGVNDRQERSLASFSMPFFYTAHFYNYPSNNSETPGMIEIWKDANNWMELFYDPTRTKLFYMYAVDGISSAWYSYSITLSTGAMHSLGIGVTSGGFYIYADGAFKKFESKNINSWLSANVIMRGWDDYNVTYSSIYDDVFVGKYINPEPVVSVGAEETKGLTDYLLHSECSQLACSAAIPTVWTWTPVNNGNNCTNVSVGGCYDWPVAAFGCEDRVYKCATGQCVNTPSLQTIDTCIGNIFNDYGCSGGSCLAPSIADCSGSGSPATGDADNSAVACNCQCNGYDADERFYQSFKLDGVDDYIDAGNGASLDMTTNDFTIEAWAKSDGYTSGGTILSKGNWFYSGGPGYYIAYPYSPKSIYVGFRDTVTHEINIGMGETFDWSYIVMVKNGTKIKAYVNGIEKSGGMNLDNASGSISNANNLFIGKNQVMNGFFKGNIKDIRLYKRALSQAEILQHYKGEFLNNTDLAGYWPLDGNANDLSGNGNNGTLNLGTKGNITIANAWPSGKKASQDYYGLKLNGTSDFVELGYIFNPWNKNFTVSSWIKQNANVSKAPVFAKGGDCYGFALYVDNGVPIFAMDNNSASCLDGSTQISSSVLNNGEWHNLIGVFNYPTMYFYVDGILKGNVANNYFTGNPSETSQIGTDWPCSVLDDNCGLQRFFNGTISDTRVYERALSDNEIYALYSNGTVSDIGLVGRWKLNGNANDISGNGNNGTLEGSPTWVTDNILFNNVPTPWKVCSDGKDNNCNGRIDSVSGNAEIACDNNPPALSFSASYDKDGAPTVINSGDIVFDSYLSDPLKKLSFNSFAADEFGIPAGAHIIEWTKDNWLNTNIIDCTAGSCMPNLVDGGQFPIGTVVRYRVSATDNNWNKICVPNDCSLDYYFTIEEYNTAPVAVPLSITQPGDYCTTGPNLAVQWSYNDADGDVQGAYQVQVATDSGFSSIIKDSCVDMNTCVLGNVSNTYSISSGLPYNTKYYWRFKVWDQHGMPAEESGSCGSGWICSTSQFTTTPLHQYPSASFDWTPLDPKVSDEVQFNNTSALIPGLTWAWDLNSPSNKCGLPGYHITVANQDNTTDWNPAYIYSQPVNYAIGLKVTDTDNYSCELQRCISIGRKPPHWKEIVPK